MNITIQGRQVSVSDDFMNLSPEEQDDTVDEIAQSMGAAPEPAPEPAVSTADGGSALGAGIANAAQSVSLGGAEEGKAAGWAGIDWLRGKGFDYDKRLAETRGDLEARTEAHKGASLAGAVGGVFLLPGGAYKTGLGLLGNATRAAVTGGGLAAGYGFGSGEGGVASRARSGLERLGIGFGVGGLAGGIGSKVLSGLEGRATTKATNRAIGEAAANAPTPSQNWAEGNAAHEALKARGIKFEDTASARLLAGVRDGLKDFDMDTAGPTLRRLNYLASKSENGLSFTGLMNTRSALRIHTLNRGTSDAEAAKVAMGKIDEFMDGVLDADVKSGNVNTAGLNDDWKDARALWTTFKKSDRIAKAIENAKDAAGGVEKGLKSEFRKILKKENLTYAEKLVVREVLKGSKVGNLIRDHAGTVMGGLAGHAIGGPWGALVGAAAGKALGRVGGRISEGATEDAAQQALGFVANGSRYTPPPPVTMPLTGNVLRRFGTGMSAGGVNYWNR
jgi:hypothetical protein